jgi:nucleoid DNA-binding protein
MASFPYFPLAFCWDFSKSLRLRNIMANLTKRDLVVRISNETGMVQQDVLNIVQKTLDYLTESLAMGKTVELRNFGVFEIKLREARVGRNPNKPESDVPIPPRAVVKFKAGKEMKAKVAALSEKLIANANSPAANDNPPAV